MVSKHNFTFCFYLCLHLQCAYVFCLPVGIDNRMLRGKKQFPAVANELNKWFNEHLSEGRSGVLVSHNAPVDIQFLFCEYLRAKVKLPASITLGLDTLATIKRFNSLIYRKSTAKDWPWSSDSKFLTSKGNSSLDGSKTLRHVCFEQTSDCIDLSRRVR